MKKLKEALRLIFSFLFSLLYMPEKNIPSPYLEKLKIWGKSTLA
ncbi:hypothetical protein B712_0162 [Chlamydia psittaci NJ1]|nr:hypothetical protein B712_0162 [Chlamydia psittaci NJ1]